MNLKIQIYSLLYSFLYGILLYVLLDINNNILYKKKYIFKVVISFLFVIFISLLYYLLLIKINYGILHFYFFIAMFTGYLFSFLILKKIIEKRKCVWYNLSRKVDYG